MTSPIGVGGARFHVGGDPGPVDTVYLGVFRGATLHRLGGYDEAFTRAQDWELNHRIRLAGGTVWFTPELTVTYRPRATLLALGRQYFHYGRWRRVIVREHPETASFRYLAPPAAAALVTAGLLAGLAGLASLAAGGPAAAQWLTAGLAVPLIYLAGVIAVAAALARGVPATVRARIPLVLAVMHMAWGAGFLTSPRRLHRKSDARVGQPDAATESAAASGAE